MHAHELQQTLTMLLGVLSLLTAIHIVTAGLLPPNQPIPKPPINPRYQQQQSLSPQHSYHHASAPSLPLPQQTPPHQTSQLMPSQRKPSSVNPQSANYEDPYTRTVQSLLLDLRRQLIDRGLRFDEHFKSLLSSSKVNLHNMFTNTYGMMYEQNTEIFTTMYESLEQYYATGQIPLTKSMDNFFVRLYQKIFQVFNSNNLFDSRYLECATEQLTILKPFRDVPEKLATEIRHAFVAARTFNQALNEGIDVIKRIISLEQPTQCTNLIRDKLNKHANTSFDNQVPCLSFCEQVITRCIGRSNLEPLEARWKSYVVILGELANKLSVNYNIETIIAPLDVQISEAIMNFQENAQNISNQVFLSCGRPSTSAGGGGVGLSSYSQQASQAASRYQPGIAKFTHGSALDSSTNPQQHSRLGKRAAPALSPIAVMPVTRNGPNSFHHQTAAAANSDPAGFDEPSQPRGGGQSRKNNNNIHAGRSGAHASFINSDDRSGLIDSASSPTSSLLGLSGDQLLNDKARKRPIIIDEIKNYMLSTKSFWSNLPHSVCTNNGSTIHDTNPSQSHGSAFENTQSRALSKRTQPCYSEPLGLSDMNTDLRYRREIQSLLDRLSTIYSRISDALAGVEIDWSNGALSSHQSTSAVTASPAVPSINIPHARPVNTFNWPSAPPVPHPSTINGDEETEGDEDQISEGSGCGSQCDDPSLESDQDDLSDDVSEDDQSEGSDSDEPGSNLNNSTHGSETDDQTTQPTQSGDSEAPSDNSIVGDPSKPQGNDLGLSDDLITAPGAQKSCASSLNNVITKLDQIMLLLFSLIPISLNLLGANIAPLHRPSFER